MSDMKYPHCLLLSFVVFAGLWVIWFVSSQDRGEELSQFSGRRAATPSEPEPETMVIGLAPKPDPQSGPKKSRDASPGNQPKAAREPQNLPPQPERPAEELAGRSAGGLAVQQLDLEFEPGLLDGSVLDHLQREGCSLALFKVERRTSIVDAFLPTADGDLERARGRSASQRVDAFLAAHPCKRQFWVRWHDVDSPIGLLARSALDDCGLPPEDFKIYVVLSETLSQEIQRLLEAEARNRSLLVKEVAYAKVMLRGSAGDLSPVVLDLWPAESKDPWNNETTSAAAWRDLSTTEDTVPGSPAERVRGHDAG